MLMALLGTLLIAVLDSAGVAHYFLLEQSFIEGLALAMALSLPAGTEKDLILHMTYGVVAFSIIVQGFSIARIFKADALKRLLPEE